MVATEDMLRDLRVDLGDEAGAFTDEELRRLLVRSVHPTSGLEQPSVALAMGIFQLLTQAARFASYTVNEAEERRGEIWKQLEGTYQLLLRRPDVNDALGSAGSNGAVAFRAFTYTKTRGQYDEYGIPR